MGTEDMIEKASDAGIEKAGEEAEAKTGGKGGQQIEQAEKFADGKIGE
jgi:hypothetical protein